MAWGEAYRLVRVLLSDPTSWTAAAVAGWEHPWSREAFVLADLFDLTRMVHTDRKHRGQVTTYPRPSRPRRPRKGVRSSRPTVDQATIRAALAASGPVRR